MSVSSRLPDGARRGMVILMALAGSYSRMSTCDSGCGGAKSCRAVGAAVWHDVRAILELFALVFGLFRLALRSRGDLVAENLLLRQQLAVLSRPSRERPRLRTRD